MRISDWSSDVCSSDLLAVVHRRVRAVYQGLRPVAVLGRARDADAGGDRELLLLEPEDVAEGIEDGIGDALGPILVVLGAAYDQEYVAAEAGDQALGAHRAHAPARGVHQQFVAGVVAEHVVDRKSTRLNS